MKMEMEMLRTISVCDLGTSGLAPTGVQSQCRKGEVPAGSPKGEQAGTTKPSKTGHAMANPGQKVIAAEQCRRTALPRDAKVDCSQPLHKLPVGRFRMKALYRSPPKGNSKRNSIFRSSACQQVACSFNSNNAYNSDAVDRNKTVSVRTSNLAIEVIS